jgi:hypothetical protein
MKNSQLVGIMGRFCCFFLLMFVLSGCANRKAFLTLPADQRQNIHFTGSTRPRTNPSFTTVTGRNALQPRDTGAVGALVVGSIRIAADTTVDEYLKAIRAVTGDFEAALIDEYFRGRLAAAGVTLKPEGEGPRLETRLQSFGIREVQRGFYAPFAVLTARLNAPDGKNIWTADAQSVAPSLRRKEEYARDPTLYSKEFAQIADDLARQLVEGPIRQFEQ